MFFRKASNAVATAAQQQLSPQRTCSCRDFDDGRCDSKTAGVIELNDEEGEVTETFSHLSCARDFSLPKTLVKNMPKIYDETVEPLDLSFGLVRKDVYRLTVKEAQEKALSTRRFAKRAKASICFIVKRPGCVICKEQGMMLQELVESFPENRVAAWAVIKEINVDNAGLLELYQKYFSFPFFLDKKMKIYKAMGKKLINPFKFLNNVKKGARERISNKGIEGTFIGKGEGLILGGVIIFDAKGAIQYAYQEKSGAQELPIEEFRVVLNAIIHGQRLDSQ
jgi:hypothetical protein